MAEKNVLGNELHCYYTIIRPIFNIKEPDLKSIMEILIW